MMTDYKELYLLYCANLNDCTTKEDVKRHNVAMKNLGNLFYRIEGEPDKSFLLELSRFQHSASLCGPLSSDENQSHRPAKIA